MLLDVRPKPESTKLLVKSATTIPTTMEEHQKHTTMSDEHLAQISKTQTDILAAIRETQAMQATILSILERPALDKAKADAAQAEAIRTLGAAYASGDLGHVSG